MNDLLVDFYWIYDTSWNVRKEILGLGYGFYWNDNLCLSLYSGVI